MQVVHHALRKIGGKLLAAERGKRRVDERAKARKDKDYGVYDLE